MGVFGGRLIAHRGNILGPNPDRENSPQYIDEALSRGFDSEIDFWIVDGTAKLGHDSGQYPISLDWLQHRQEKLWIHCKNHEAVTMMSDNNFNWFFHDKDAYTLTSKGHVWCYPGVPIAGASSIALHFGRSDPTRREDLYGAYGICGDFIAGWDAARHFSER